MYGTTHCCSAGRETARKSCLTGLSSCFHTNQYHTAQKQKVFFSTEFHQPLSLSLSDAYWLSLTNNTTGAAAVEGPVAAEMKPALKVLSVESNARWWETCATLPIAFSFLETVKDVEKVGKS